MLPLAFTAAVSLQEYKSRDFRVPMGEPASPPPGLKRGKGWEQLTSGRLSVSWDHKKGMLPVLEDTNFYCRVSTKASNSRTFFSCTASFSGSESCTGRGEKSCLFR